LQPVFQTGIWYLECDIGYGGHMHIPLDNIAYIEEMTYRDEMKHGDEISKGTNAAKTPGHLR